MRLKAKVISCVLAVICIAGISSCTHVDDNAKQVVGQYISAIADGDTTKIMEISDLSADEAQNYFQGSYKDVVVSTILNSSTYVIDDENSSAKGKNSEGHIVCTLSIPDYTVIDSNDPLDMDDFISQMSSAAKKVVTINIDLICNDGVWTIVNSKSCMDTILNPLYVPNYIFAQNSEFLFESAEIDSVSGTSRGSISEDITDALEIILNIQLSPEGEQEFSNLHLTYELVNSEGVVIEGNPILRDDGLSVVTLRPSMLEQAPTYFPQDTYTLSILRGNRVIWSDTFDVYLSESAFPSRSVLQHIFWQHADSSGSYFNTNQIEAKLVLDSSYIESGRDLNITYNILADGEYLVQDVPLDFDVSGTVCVYTSPDNLPTGNYMVEVYNNGLVCGTASVSVVFNLDPTRYQELEVATDVTDSEDGELLIYSGSIGAADLINEYTNVNFTRRVLNLNTFRNELDAILASGDNAPDMFVCDIGYASYYAQSEYTIPLNDIGIDYDEFRYMYEYTFAMGMDSDGVIKGVTWEVHPGAVFYNRNVAQNVLGVSEPEEVQPYFSSWDSFLSTAQFVRESTNGNTRIVCDTADIETPYIMSRSDSWFVDGEVQISDYMEDLFSISRTMYDEELTWGSARWSSEWSGRMTNRSVLSYFGTLDFGRLFLTNTYNNWGVVRAPEDYYDGGYYIFVTRYCDMDFSASRIIRDVTTSTINLEDMASDGCTVNNLNIMLSCSDDDSYARSWLGGQNPYSVFTGAAWALNNRALSVYDADINNAFASAVRNYTNGNYSTLSQSERIFLNEVDALL